MTTDQILLTFFGLSNIALLTGIFRKIGGFEAMATTLKERFNALSADNKVIWTELNRLKENKS